ncbi:hypothetical protein VKT23_019254 [Stygiomarasmius scandens]|uniref:Xylanolytic transcriptional activator regulatory domain-containing protein n=1 Tax=Marasmiellus scandens TaxID=2682957 RepID=A0ABR1INZ6_9AGAR
MESRIRELENPTQPPESIVLQNPYVESVPTQTAQTISHSGELPAQLRQSLLTQFLTYASELGFFLNPACLSEPSATSSLSAPIGLHTTPALSYAALLLGAQLTSPQVVDLDIKAGLLAKTLDRTSSILSTNHPDKALHAIQIHVLLSHYFLMNDRSLEGKYNLTMAISLVLSTRLHRIRSHGDSEISSQASLAFPGIGVVPNSALALPKDVAEEKERIDAFWTVLSLNSCWSSLEGTTSSFAYWKPELNVDTPWPGVDLDPNAQSSSTIQWFLSNTPDGAYSIMALHAKASILFEQSFELTRSYDSTPFSETIQTWLLKWNTLQSLTQRFQSEVPSVESAESAAASRRLLVIHTLLCVTKIRVLRPLPAQVYDVSNENIRKVAIEAALLMRRVDLRETAFIDPILAMLWSIIGKTLSEEISRDGSTQVEVDEMRDALDTITQTMLMLSPSYPLMGRFFTDSLSPSQKADSFMIEQQLQIIQDRS